ncbi:MAG: hypothetical protein IPK02_14805 [Candidatus Accumulibacter sp.]|uniref:Uncharacterized protein n=1 Tax=Candidatus Accumulibacter affinis TaxID=2954384 RepID=A0A935W871_9PROT|nr:hypothetical protein [Candidatus Accumulibacter affinis]
MSERTVSVVTGARAGGRHLGGRRGAFAGAGGRHERFCRCCFPWRRELYQHGRRVHVDSVDANSAAQVRRHLADIVDAQEFTAAQVDLAGHRRLATQLHARHSAEVGRQADAQNFRQRIRPRFGLAGDDQREPERCGRVDAAARSDEVDVGLGHGRRERQSQADHRRSRRNGEGAPRRATQIVDQCFSFAQMLV